MINTARFEKFEKTNLYMNFGMCLQWDINLLEVQDLDFYKHTLEQLITNFKCNHQPNEDQMDTYILNEEIIDDEDEPEFITLITIIFDKCYTIYNKCKDLYTKSVVNNIKQQEKDKKIKEKQLIQEQKLRDKEEQRRIKMEAKQREIEYNLEILTCNCGSRCRRSSMTGHLTSHDHIIRLDAIRWYAEKHGLSI